MLAPNAAPSSQVIFLRVSEIVSHGFYVIKKKYFYFEIHADKKKTAFGSMHIAEKICKVVPIKESKQ